MDDGLLTEVLERLDSAGLDAATEALVLAACTDELDQVLGDGDYQRPEPVPAEERQPVGAYLTGISVEGFRGIGPRTKLDIAPGPGLTVVIGRNGSGKSSFAEAAEVVLTGTCARWEDAGNRRVWRDGWRNLHAGATPHLQLDLVEEGQTARTVLTRNIGADGECDTTPTTVRRAGQADEPFGALGWTEDLIRYRPILSYHELGGMLQDSPTKLYDAIAGILGVGELAESGKRLANARLERERSKKDVKKALDLLLPRLRGLDDDRARAVADALDGKRWDLDAAELVLIEDDEHAPSAISTLRGLVSLTLPTAEALTEAAGRLDEARRRADEVAGTDAGRARRLAGLLQQAVDAHDSDGHEVCPVCRSGRLDASWREETLAQITQLSAEADEARRAEKELGEARRLAAGLPVAVPQVVTAAEGLDEVVDLTTLVEAWERWAAVPTEDGDLVDHLLTVHERVRAALAAVQEAATTALDGIQADWRPVATAATGWIADARQAEEDAVAAKQIRSAENWLKSAMQGIQTDRFAPIEAQTRELWGTLRVGSNVDLEQLALTGSSNTRKVDLAVTVDDVEANALGVMSQGELHALALALFVPRATRPESPFRFLLIDDPVQSMDPARVDSLARVVAQVAETRQVVVFTHDDRLPEALRRLELPASVVGVTRQEGSVVSTAIESDPATRALDEARGLTYDEALEGELANRLVPVFCRTAVEAAADRRTRRVRLAKGASHREVEEAILGCKSLREHLMLALFDEGEQGDPGKKLNFWGKPYADAYGWMNRGSHGGELGHDATTLRSYVGQCEALVKRLGKS